MRYALKTDTVQAEIVEGLRKIGVRVEVIGQPVDLICQYWSKGHQQFLWTPMEIKTPTKAGRPRSDKRQKAQLAFIAQTQCPVVTTLEEAIAALRGL